MSDTVPTHKPPPVLGDGNNRLSGHCCAGVHCQHGLMQLSQEHKCWECREMVHILCGVHVEGTDHDVKCLSCVNNYLDDEEDEEEEAQKQDAEIVGP
jgi:hypothetical protein